MYIYMRIHIYIPLMCMNILIYGYGYLTSSIWSEYPSEQIRPPTAALSRCCLIGITRVGSSKADPTKIQAFKNLENS